MPISSFLKKDFVKNVITLLSGSVLSQVIIYLSILWLTRLFSKELFGVYTLFTSIILVLNPITSLRLQLAILLPKKKKYAINALALSIITVLILNLLILFILIIFKNTICLFFGIALLGDFIYLIPLASFLVGSINSLNYWNNRIKKFNVISSSNIIKSSFMSSSQIITGYSNFSSLGLIPGVIIGQIFQFIFQVSKSMYTFKDDIKEISINRMLSILKKYKDIPLFNTLISFSNSLSNEIPVLLITKFFGLDFSGIYGLSIKIGKAPSGVFQESISQVFFNKATETFNNKQNLHSLVKQTTIHLFKLSLTIFSIIFILSFFLDHILGKNWIEVGLYLRILIPWLFVMFVNSPLTTLITILNKQKVILTYDIILSISRFSAFYMGYYIFNSITIALGLFSIVGFLFNTLMIIYLNKISKNHTPDISIY